MDMLIDGIQVTSIQAGTYETPEKLFKNYLSSLNSLERPRDLNNKGKIGKPFATFHNEPNYKFLKANYGGQTSSSKA